MAEPIMAQPRSGQPPSRLIYFSPSVYLSNWTNLQLSQKKNNLAELNATLWRAAK